MRVNIHAGKLKSFLSHRNTDIDNKLEGIKYLQTLENNLSQL